MTVDRRQREIVRTREDILEAAARAFASSGFDAATMQDIAREAGYTAASLYTYFKSKQEIVCGLIELLTGEFQRVFEEPLPPGLSFQQKFEIVLMKQLEVLDRRRGLMMTFQTAPGNACDGLHQQMFHDNFSRRVSAMVEWLKANATPEELGQHEPELVAHVLFGIAFGLVHRWAAAGAKEPIASRAQVITQFFFHGVAGNPASANGATAA